MLGILIGALLLLKIAILRFFRHFERWMPYVGTGLFLCTVLLLGLSVPSVVHEQELANSAVGGGVYSAEDRKRVAELLQQAGFAPGTPLQSLSTDAGLRARRAVLLEKCGRCHDLKTVLARPRTPSEWLNTVHRMAAKPALFGPITDKDQEEVCAYLIGITPDLERSMSVLAQPLGGPMVPDALPAGRTELPAGAGDALAERSTFEKVCSQCHAASRVDKSPPRTAAAVQSLMQRMRDNGMRASKQDLTLVRLHLTRTFVGAR